MKDGKNPGAGGICKASWMFILDRVTGKLIFRDGGTSGRQGGCAGRVVFADATLPAENLPPLARTSYKPEDMVTAADTDGPNTGEGLSGSEG